MPDVPCPSCGAPLTGRPAACLSCGLPLTGPDALRLWQIDQTIGALQSERQVVLARLRDPRTLGQGPGSPTPDPRSRSLSKGHRETTPAVPAPTPPGPRWTGQQVLLSVGALLVLVAATVFVAVNWTALGVAGQVAVMAAVTVLAGGASLSLARRGLRATAIALAVLTVGLATVDAGAAYTLDLAGAQQLDSIAYLAGAAAVLAVAFALVSWRDLSILPFSWASVVAAAVVPFAVLLAGDPSAAVMAWVTLLAAAVFGTLRRALPDGWAAYRGPLLIAAGGHLAASWLVALPAVFERPLRGDPAWCSVAALLAAAGCAVLARLDHGLRILDRHPVLAVAAVLSAAIVLVGLADHARPVGPVVLAVLGATLSAGIWFARRPLQTHPLGFPAVAAQLAGVGAVLDLSVYARYDRADPHWVPLSLALAAVALGAAVIAVRQSFLRVRFAGYAMAAGVAAAAAAADPYQELPTAIALLTGAVVAAGLAGWRRTHGEEVSLAVVALASAVGAVWFGDLAGVRPLAWVLAVSGLAALAYGVLPGRGYVAILGVLGCSAATWTLFLDADVRVVEAYSLPLATLAALVRAGPPAPRSAGTVVADRRTGTDRRTAAVGAPQYRRRGSDPAAGGAAGGCGGPGGRRRAALAVAGAGRCRRPRGGRPVPAGGVCRRLAALVELRDRRAGAADPGGQVRAAPPQRPTGGALGGRVALSPVWDGSRWVPQADP